MYELIHERQEERQQGEQQQGEQREQTKKQALPARLREEKMERQDSTEKKKKLAKYWLRLL